MKKIGPILGYRMARDKMYLTTISTLKLLFKTLEVHL